MQQLRLGTAAAALLLIAACGTPIDNPTVLRASGRPIYFGTPDLDPDHMAVVALTTNQGFFCSGTLITDTVVVTAAHCLESSSAGSTRIFFGQDSNAGNGDYRDVQEWLVYPDYDSQNLTGDIGIIRLDSPAPEGITPIPHLPRQARLTSNDEGGAVEFSGFGVTETGSDGSKLHVNGTINVVCAGPDACSGGNVAPRAFQYLQGSGGPCSGDSGGPAFIIRGTQEYVAGVTSYGDWNCSEFGVSTTVSEYAGWIESFIAGGGVEDCVNGLDDDGDSLIDCDDPSCNRAPDCIGPTACEAPALVACGTDLSDSTANGSFAFTSNGCAQNPGSSWDGPEVAFELNVAAGTNVTVNMQPTGGGDLDMIVLSRSSGSCDLNSCLDASMEPGNTGEAVSFTMPAGGAYVIVDTWDSASPFNLTVNCAGEPVEPVEVCGNGLDDDFDGTTDCADADCAADAACQGGTSPATPVPYSGKPKDSGGCNSTGNANWPAGFALIFLLMRRRRD